MKRFLVIALVLMTKTVLSADLGEEKKPACFKHNQAARVEVAKGDKLEVKKDEKKEEIKR